MGSLKQHFSPFGFNNTLWILKSSIILLVKGAIADGGVAGAIGVGALLISALLTANYMMTITVRAFFKEGNSEDKGKDPTWRMLIPLYLFAAFCVLLGFASAPIVTYFGQIATGLL